jgi:anaerobic C4-dicarboxylate transporter DcuB
MRRHKIVTGLNGESVNHQPYYPQNADSFPAFLAPAGFFPFDSVILSGALGAFPDLRPAFGPAGNAKPLSMNLAIQIMMLCAGALILLFCKVRTQDIPDGTVFKAGMMAVVSILGVAWMADTFFEAHFELIKASLAGVVQVYPWTYALVLFIVSKLVNSQAAAIAAIAPLGVSLGVDPKIMLAFLPAAYGYFILPTYASDLACISFDRSGTTRIGKFVINHSFIVPGLIGVGTGCAVGFILVRFAF